MSFGCKAGETLYLNDEAGGHLKLVATNPDENGIVVLISFTTVKHWKEQIVYFTSSDEARLFKPGTVTTVSYEYAILARAKELISGVAQNPKRRGPVCPQHILEAIVAGARSSQRIPPLVFAALRRGYPNLFT